MTDDTSKTVEAAAITKPVCPYCKGDQVVKDAWAEWCSVTDNWVLKTTFDHFVCDACGGEIGKPTWVELDKTEAIQIQNDRFRKGDRTVLGRHFLTSGIQELSSSNGVQLSEIIEMVAAFDTFTEDNDPHKEHDFGQFTFQGQSCFWKIDYYNSDLDGGSEDPSDLTQTHRVLTIMRADEY